MPLTAQRTTAAAGPVPDREVGQVQAAVARVSAIADQLLLFAVHRHRIVLARELSRHLLPPSIAATLLSSK
jgi:hypothetical protein